MEDNKSSSNSEKIKRTKWIAVSLVLVAMLVTGSFAVSSINATPNTTSNTTQSATSVLQGDNVEGQGKVLTPQIFQWKENCVITNSSPFKTVIAKCTKPLVKVKLIASKGYTGTVTIDHLQCFAEFTTTALISAQADEGLLIDVMDSPDTNMPRANGVNQWIVTFNNCDKTGGLNQFIMQIHVLTAGTHDVELTIEPIAL